MHPHFSLVHLINQIRLWHRRLRDRRHLAHLDAHTLKDMGTNCVIAAREARRPFWRPIDLCPDNAGPRK